MKNVLQQKAGLFVVGLVAAFALVGFASSANAALTLGALSATSDGALSLEAAAASNIVLGSAQTSGTIAIGGTAGTGAISLGSSTGAQTVNIGVGASGVKTINIGTDATANVITVGNALGGLRYFAATETMTADDTLAVAESGKTFYMGTAGVDLTLPAVATANGVFYRFVVSAAFATTNMTIVTGSSANVIEGTMEVAGAVVDCRGEDTISFVNDGEALGDWVELRSNGTNWFLNGSALTAAKLTCTQAS